MNTKPAGDPPKSSDSAASKSETPPEDHVQDTLDEALDETFPASDPVAMLEPTTNAARTKNKNRDRTDDGEAT